MIIHPYLEKTHLQYLHPEKSSKMPSEIGFWTSWNTTPPLTFQHFSSSSIGQYIIKTHLPYYVSQFFTCVGTKKAAPLLENHGFPHYAIVDPQKKISAIPNWGLSAPIWHQKISVGTGINSTQKAVAAKTCGPPWWIFVAGMHQQSENVESKVSGIGSFALPPRCQGRLPLVPFFEIITDHVYIYIYIYMQAYVYTYLSCKLDCVHVPVYNHVIRVYCILCIYIYILIHFHVFDATFT